MTIYVYIYIRCKWTLILIIIDGLPLIISALIVKEIERGTQKRNKMCVPENVIVLLIRALLPRRRAKLFLKMKRFFVPLNLSTDYNICGGVTTFWSAFTYQFRQSEGVGVPTYILYK